MTRNQSRGISRRRKRIQALNPCMAFSHNGGHNPFDYLFAKMVRQDEMTDDEKKLQHKIKMMSDQKSAKARKERKRNKAI